MFPERKRNEDPTSPVWNCGQSRLLVKNPNALETPNYRVLPIFAGILVPFSILFSIPSLTDHWYIQTDGGVKVIEKWLNRRLLKIAMCTSMSCGLAACACLVARFSGRKVRLMTLWCILFLTAHDLLDIIAVSVFGFEHYLGNRSHLTYGESFWLTVCSTLVSTTANIVLIIDYNRTPGFDKRGSALTHKQRSLLIIVIIFLCYVALGSLILSSMLNLSFIDALYLSVVSIETIGFGDLHPENAATYWFVCIYTSFGILNLALGVSLSRDAILEAISVTLQARLRAIRVRHRERGINARWTMGIKWRLKTQGLPVWVTDKSVNKWWNRFSFKNKTGAMWKYAYGRSQKRLNIGALTLSQLEAAALEAGAPLGNLLPSSFNPGVGPMIMNRGENPLTHVRLGGMIAMLGKCALALGHGGLEGCGTDIPGYNFDAEAGNRATLITARDDTAEVAEEKFVLYAWLSVALILFIFFWMSGSAIFMKTENWSFGQAVYFCFVAFSTIGYGDFAPRTPAGRSIFVAWSLFGVGTMTILISILTEAYSKQYKSVIRSDVCRRRFCWEGVE